MEEQILFYNAIWMNIAKIALGFMIVPMCFAFINYEFLNKLLKLILLYLIVTFLVSLGEQLIYQLLLYLYANNRSILEYWNIYNTNFYQILFILKDFGFLGVVFYYLILPLKISKPILYLSWGLILVSLINYFFIDGYNSFSSFNSSAQSFFTFSLPIIYMWILYHTDSKIPLFKNPYFWINLGLIIPNLLSLFLYFAGDKISHSDFLLYVKIMIGRSIIEIVSQILFTIGFAHGRYAQFLR
jgi:hypothetical protein